MNEIKDLRRDDRIILWQYRGLNVQDGHAGVVIREVDRLGKQSVMVQLDGIDDPFELTDEDYFDKKAEHFEDYKNIPEHYQGTGDIDVIEFCRQHFTPEEFRGAMKFNLIKYPTRLGRKDALDKELDKIIDYAQRLKEGL
ncbi:MULTISPECIES: DUF3310 domain-containing protein [unclassified Staphylococcus]|uniref:DUF3310 domain-containing protein n=1 Tax=unclassified Staphylococcus TaxID=91994 RepID=UPI0008A3BB38|nr:MULTISPECIES: DUF3310 domain-containing protein [unclassified Staphylococcus]OFM15735.1 hypothetical protein HMPREF2713_09005 [Staphylococcus sp. HMSC059E03]OFN21181.1 hypothetical protein HMPREF2603_05310 [Staphylococcus sp. HMSC055C03]OHR51724.1 hypothetical protein HMPREF2951_08485 [Staphylococcus sp. HMSC056D08]OHR53770.1 hypothetical protein HMPREF3021_01705 [Staphylococcus sp. HMSC070A02]OHR56691.1 hypothetical protein HMPREF2798_03425 [Staphylococcus sp. HMSC070A03]